MARLVPPPRRRRPIALCIALVVAAALTPAASALAATLPPDFPADVPLPPAQLQGSTGGAGQWSVLLLANGPADVVHASTVAFYVAHGFVADTDSIVHDATHQVTVVVENRDHSAAHTFVLIAVVTRAATPATPAPAAAPSPAAPAPAAPAPAPAPSSRRVALAARLAGHGRGRATVTVTGARVCWRVRGLTGAGRPTRATIRRYAAGRTGRVVVRLGRRWHPSGCTAVATGLGRAIAARPTAFAVSVATRAHPRGAVRGRLHRV